MLTHPIRIRRKGQMTLPAEVCKDLKLEEGDVVYLEKQDGTYTLVTSASIVERTAGIFAEYANNVPVEIDRDAIWGEIAEERHNRLMKQIAEEAEE